jgi:phosphate transport system substrate-binding protein
VTEDLSQKGQALRALMVDGTPGTIAALRSGSYPLSRPLNLVTREVPKGLARAFIEYALSAQAREVIRQFDFVPYEN